MHTLSIESLELLEAITAGPDVTQVELVDEGNGGLSVHFTCSDTWRRVWVETQNGSSSLAAKCEAAVLEAMRADSSLVRLALQCQAGPTAGLTEWEIDFFKTLAARVSTPIPAKASAPRAALHA